MQNPNPIFYREIQSAARDPKIVCLVLGFIIILGSILLFLWPSTGVFTLASDSSMEIFSIFLMSNLALVILLVPALTSPTITTERENNSFDLLFTSLLSSGEMLRGKLFAGITMILVVIVLAMPVAALCSLSGGIGPGLLLRAYGVIAMSALTYGMMGLAFSALCRRTFTALILSYVGVAVLAGGTYLPYSLLGRVYALRWLWQFIRSLSPFDAIYSLVFPKRYALTQLSMLSDHVLFNFYFHLCGMAILATLFLVIFCKYVLVAPKPGTIYRWLAIGLTVFLIPFVIIQGYVVYIMIAQQGMDAAQLAQAPRLSGRGGPPILRSLGLFVVIDIFIAWMIGKMRKLALTDGSKYEDQFSGFKEVAKRKLTWPFYLIDPLKRKKPIKLWTNPIFIAELRSKIFGKPSFIIWSLAACVILSFTILILVCVQYADVLRPDTVRWVAILFQIGIVALLAPAISSGSITDEISSRTFLMLRMTPLSAVRVVLGKMEAAFLYVSIFLISSVPVLVSLAYLEVRENYWRIGAWCAVMLLTTLAFITAGLCASAFSKKTSHATAISYCFAGFICIVTLAGELPDAFSEGMRRLLLMMNPIVAALRITSDTLFSDMPPNLWIHNIVFLAAISLLFIVLSAGRVYYIFSQRM